MDRDLKTYGPFTRGVNNRLSDEALARDGKGQDVLRQAVNCHLSDTGALSRRDGYAQVKAGAEAHSLYAGELGIFYVEGVALLSYSAESGATTVLRSDLALNSAMAWLPLNGELYFSNGAQRGKVVAGVAREWGVELPAGLPVLSAGAGVLEAGQREVLCTFSNSEGEESGAGLSTGIMLAEAGGVLVGAIPQPVSSEITGINIYITPPNGEVFYLAQQVPVGTVSTLLTTLAPSVELSTQGITPPVCGNVLAYSAGIIYIAAGNVVWHTDPLTYGRCRPARNFMLFPSEVTLMAGVRDGLYVAADNTYFVAGTRPDTAELTTVLPYGAAFGSLAPTPGDLTPWTWRSDRGQVVAGDGGEVKPLQEAQLALPACTSAASVFVEADGLRQIVSVGSPKPEFRAEAQDFIEMELRRKGA